MSLHRPRDVSQGLWIPALVLGACVVLSSIAVGCGKPTTTSRPRPTRQAITLAAPPVNEAVVDYALLNRAWPNVCDCVSVKHRVDLPPPPTRAYHLDAPTSDAAHPFAAEPGADPKRCSLLMRPLAARRYGAHVDGRVVPIYVPARVAAKLSRQWADRLAHAVATLPVAQAALVTSMDAYDIPNPADPCWTRLRGKSIEAGMSADGSGLVSAFPKALLREPGPMLDRNLFHEIGHTLSFRRWGGDFRHTSWQPWLRACEADRQVPSTYARNDLGEDFADALALYLLTQDEPRKHKRFRRKLAHRFALIEQLLAEPPRSTGP